MDLCFQSQERNEDLKANKTKLDSNIFNQDFFVFSRIFCLVEKLLNFVLSAADRALLVCLWKSEQLH